MADLDRGPDAPSQLIDWCISHNQPMGTCPDCQAFDLLVDLERAEKANSYRPPGGPCRACEALSSLGPGDLHDAVQRALAGTIGNERLAAILTSHGLRVGRRAIIRHRREGH